MKCDAVWLHQSRVSFDAPVANYERLKLCPPSMPELGIGLLAARHRDRQKTRDAAVQNARIVRSAVAMIRPAGQIWLCQFAVTEGLRDAEICLAVKLGLQQRPVSLKLI